MYTIRKIRKFLPYENESTAGADASVELHNIKLLIAYFYTHECRVGNDRPWIVVKNN